MRVRHPEVANRIEELWGTEYCDLYLEELILIHEEAGAKSVFSESVYNQLQGLLDLHRALD